MIVQSASDKIIREIEMFGENFERFQPEDETAPAAPTTDGPAKAVDKAKKGKVAAKATGLQYQFQIMESMGVPREEIKKFADPYFWLQYYPPICIVRMPKVSWHAETERLCRRTTSCSARESIGAARSSLPTQTRTTTPSSGGR